MPNGAAFLGLADSFNKGLGSGVSLFQALTQQQAIQKQNELSNNIALARLYQEQQKGIADQASTQAGLNPAFRMGSSNFGPSLDPSSLTGQMSSMSSDLNYGPVTPNITQPTQEPIDYRKRLVGHISSQLPGYGVDDLDVNALARLAYAIPTYKGTLGKFKSPANQKQALDIILNTPKIEEAQKALGDLSKSAELDQFASKKFQLLELAGKTKDEVKNLYSKTPGAIGFGFGKVGPFNVADTLSAVSNDPNIETRRELERVKDSYFSIASALIRDAGANVSKREEEALYSRFPSFNTDKATFEKDLQNWEKDLQSILETTKSGFSSQGKELGKYADFNVSSLQAENSPTNPPPVAKPSLQDLFKSDPATFRKAAQQEILNRAKAKQAGFKVSDPQPGVNFTPDTGLPQQPQQTDINGLVMSAAERYKIDPRILKALVRQESGGNPKARSSAGAMGVMQLMPATAKAFGVTDPFDPAQNIDAGARYLSQLIQKYNGDVAMALAHYNGGGGAVQHFKKKGGIGLRNPYAPANSWDNQTAGYVNNILGAM